MVNPVGSSSEAYASQVSHPAVRQPQPQQAQEPQDTVSLKGAGDVDHDGDSK